MASSSSTSIPIFNSVEEELNYWKKGNLELLNQKRCLNCPASDEDTDANPMKKARVKLPDPLKFFPSHIQDLIFDQMSEVDVYKMTKVSNYWKIVIEGNKKAAIKLQMAKIYTDKEPDEVEEVLKNEIDYDEANFMLNSRNLVCIKKSFASLKNLKITDTFRCNGNFYEENLTGIVFHRLEKLEIFVEGCDLFCKWLRNCKFPVLKEFIIFCIYEKYRYNYRGIFRPDDDCFKFLWSAPNLKLISITGKLAGSLIDKLPNSLILNYGETLTQLELERILADNLSEILRKMKNLEKLVILHIEILELHLRSYPINLSIKHFETLDRYTNVKRLLDAMPNLEFLKFQINIQDGRGYLSVNAGSLKTIVYQLPKLKKLVCYDFDYLIQAYREMKNSLNDDFNKNIEIEANKDFRMPYAE